MTPAIVSDIIIRKYPAPIRRAFFQQCSIAEPTFKQFVDLMNETIRKEELINPISVAEVIRPAKEKSVVAAATTAKPPGPQKTKFTKKGDKKSEAKTDAISSLANDGESSRGKNSRSFGEKAVEIRSFSGAVSETQGMAFRSAINSLVEGAQVAGNRPRT